VPYGLNDNSFLDKGDSKQINQLSLLISRLFLLQVHEGKGSLSEHLKEFRKKIFEGLTFNLEDL